MILHRLYKEFGEYYLTQDYLRGVLIEITGIFIELIFISIAIPAVYYIIRRISTRPIRLTFDFYLFQIFHKLTRMFLEMASISSNDVIFLLMDEMTRNPNLRVFSHYIYGNLENILYVLNKLFEDGERFSQEIAKRTLQDFQRYSITCDRCMDEIDRLIIMLSVFSKIQEELINMRTTIYLLRDAIEVVILDFQDPKRKAVSSNHRYNLERLAKVITNIIVKTFRRRRKLSDSTMRNRHYSWVVRLFTSLPYYFFHEKIGIPICRYLKVAYHLSPYETAPMLYRWRKMHGFSIEQAAEIMAFPIDDYRDYEYGYKKAGYSESETIRKKIRDKWDWNVKYTLE